MLTIYLHSVPGYLIDRQTEDTHEVSIIWGGRKADAARDEHRASGGRSGAGGAEREKILRNDVPFCPFAAS